MVDDAFREDAELAGGNEQPVAGAAERGQYVPDPGVKAVLIDTDAGISLAIMRHGEVCGRVAAQQYFETASKRRTDAPGQFIRGRDRAMTELFEGILDRTGDSDFGVGQRAVEVEKYRIHGFPT